MNLQQILARRNINRNTYNSWDRETGLPFMKMRLSDGGRDGRFRISHEVALACFDELRRANVDLKRAARTIEETFEYLDDNVETALEGGANLEEPNWISHHNHGPLSWGFSASPGSQDGQRDLALNDQPNSVVIVTSVNFHAILKRIMEDLPTTEPTEAAA